MAEPAVVTLMGSVLYQELLDGVVLIGIVLNCCLQFAMNC